MSTISGASTGLAQFFQTVDKSSATQSAATDQAGGATKAHHHGGHHRGGGGSSTISAIQDAVSSALQAAGSNSASGSTSTDGTTTDPNKLVEQAIASVLQKTGGLGAPPPRGDAPNDGDSDDAAKAGATSGGNSQRQAFVSLLKQSGIDPKQFHADFLAAVKDVQAGNSSATDSSTAFQSVSPGLAVDAAA